MSVILPAVTATLVTESTRIRGEFRVGATRAGEAAVIIDTGYGQFAMTVADFEAFAPTAVFDVDTLTYNDPE